MPVERCSVPDCPYATGDYPIIQVLEALRLHSRGAHPENFAVVGGAGNLIEAQRREKPKRPTLHMTGQTCEEQDWEYFNQQWQAYKGMCAINAANANMFFRDSLPEEVGRMLYSTYGNDVAKQDEATLIANTKKMVVQAKTKYALVVELEGVHQQPDEKAEAFLARLKLAACQIGFKKKKKTAPAIQQCPSR